MNKREKKLLIIFGSICLCSLLAAGGHYGYTWYQRLKRDIISINDQIASAEYWIERKEELDSKQSWMEKNLPALTDRNSSTSELISLLQSTSKKHNLTFERQEVLEPEKNSNNIRIRLEVIAPMRSIVGWLNELQRPKSMLAIPELSMETNSENDAMKLSMLVYRFYMPARKQDNP